MPFISKDWRSPGEQWVKIGPGWERAKVLSYLSSSGYFHDGLNAELGCRDESVQPRYNVTTRTTREIRGQNTLSEALLQLDFYSACHDIRRFNYTCRMIQLLVLNLNFLPGNVQRILIRLVEQMAAHAREHGWKGEVRSVIQAISDTMQNQPVWGGQLGSAKLWEEHKSNIQKILSSYSDENYEWNQKAPPMQDFPEEVLRQVLLKLNSPSDIESLSNANLLLSQIADENRIWRELCQYHFTPQQIALIHDHLIKVKEKGAGHRGQTPPHWSRQGKKLWKDDLKRDAADAALQQGKSDSEGKRPARNCNPTTTTTTSNTNVINGDKAGSGAAGVKGQSDIYPHWKLKFKSLKRRYGLAKEEYAEELNLCKSCGLLFWTSPKEPHPLHDCPIPILIPVKPCDFIKYFCV